MKEYSKEEGEKLLKLARESINEEFGGKKPELPEGKKFKQARGVFVTLNKQGKLRGCIGFPYPNFSVGQAIYKAAKQAAFSDPRFRPLKQEELKEVEIEISVLSMPQECSEKDIKIGEDGLMCQCLGYSGLLLPQVATEYNMSRIEFIEALCEKAGLPKSTWQNRNFKLYKFQAEIFNEEKDK